MDKFLAHIASLYEGVHCLCHSDAFYMGIPFGRSDYDYDGWRPHEKNFDTAYLHVSGIYCQRKIWVWSGIDGNFVCDFELLCVYLPEG